MPVRWSRSLAAAVLLAWAMLWPEARAQSFGKNKITYETFDWQVYESPHFLIHYYPAMEIFLEEIVSHAESAYLHLSRELDHELRFKVPLIAYKTHGEFQQTNIELAELPDGVAAFAEPIQHRMVLPIDLPPDRLYELIAHELTHIFQYSMFFEGNLGRALRSRPPTWLMEGMASYMAKDEDNVDRMVIRDAVVGNVLPSIQQLDVLNFLTYRYGHAIFDYIEQEHGKEGVRNFLFEYRKVLLSGNLEKAFDEAFGYGLHQFDRRFNRYLRQKYFPVLLERKTPDEFAKEIGYEKPGVFSFSPAISPSGELVAVLASPKQELDLVILSADDGERIKNLTKGWTNAWRGLESNAFEGKRDLSWSPVADHVAIFVRRENHWPLVIFDALSGNVVENIVLDNIVECASPAYSPDGRRIAFEGNRDGVVDLFEYDLDTRQVRNLTQDDYFDANPWYGPDGKTLLYNRRIGEHWKVFSVDLGDAELKQQLTFGPSSDVQPSFSRDGRTIFFSSDRDPHGVFNIWALDLASGDLRKYTDVIGGVFTPVEMAERDGTPQLVFAAYFEGQFRLYRLPLEEPEDELAVAEQLDQPLDVEPFQPPLTLSVDQGAKRPYKLQWDLESPSVGVGLTDDGTFLANAYVQFADLLGNHRAFVAFSSVSDYASYQAGYINVKRRYDWGATAFSISDYYLAQNGPNIEEASTSYTGVSTFLSYPFTRHWRFETEVGLNEAKQDLPFQDLSTGTVFFSSVSDRFATVDVGFVADTTRYGGAGVAPFQGKRLNVGVVQAFHLSGDQPGDITEYRLDYRGYRQATRRSSFAFRAATRYNEGERAYVYGFGGLNQLRGYEFRDFSGSRVAWANMEFRFPLVDRLDFPVMSLGQIRGFIFLDAGTAWGAFNADGSAFYEGFYDPELGSVRFNPTLLGRDPIEFDPWDSDNDRPQDLRASYGAGFQFLFVGGLQFNWAWAQPIAHTQFCANGVAEPCFQSFEPSSPMLPVKFDPSSQFEFFIAYDW